MEYNIKLPSGRSLFKEAWATYKEKFSSLIKLSLIIFIVDVVVQSYISIQAPEPELGPSILLIALSIVLGIIGVLVSIAFILVIHDGSSPMEALRKSTRFFWPYAITSFIVGLIVTIGLLLLIVPGIIFSIWYSMVVYVVVLENIRYMAALKRSKEYVKGRVGEVFSRGIAMGLFILLLVFVPSIIIAMQSNLAANLYNSLAFLFLLPLIQIYTYRIYSHLKTIKASAEQPAIDPLPTNPLS